MDRSDERGSSPYFRGVKRITHLSETHQISFITA